LLRRVPGPFHGRVPGLVWPDEDSHSPWTSFRGPRQDQRGQGLGSLPVARVGEGDRGMGADGHHAQPAQAVPGIAGNSLMLWH